MLPSFLTVRIKGHLVPLVTLPQYEAIAYAEAWVSRKPGRKMELLDVSTDSVLATYDTRLRIRSRS